MKNNVSPQSGVRILGKFDKSIILLFSFLLSFLITEIAVPLGRRVL